MVTHQHFPEFPAAKHAGVTTTSKVFAEVSTTSGHVQASAEARGMAGR